MRFRLLPLAIELIGLSTTQQEYEERLEYVVTKRHGKWSNESVTAHY